MRRGACMPEDRLINATCPDCRGPLSEVIEDGVREYRGLVEHRFSATAPLGARSNSQERALWSGVGALEEARLTAGDIARHAPHGAERLLPQADQKSEQA